MKILKTGAAPNDDDNMGKAGYGYGDGFVDSSGYGFVDSGGFVDGFKNDTKRV